MAPPEHVPLQDAECQERRPLLRAQNVCSHFQIEPKPPLNVSTSFITGNSDKGISWPVTALILSNVIIGVGLLNFPRAYVDSGGLSRALIAQTICIAFIIAGLIMLGHCTQKSGKETLQSLIEYYTGIKGLAICNFFIVIHNFGTCITLLIIVADQVDDVMNWIFGPEFCHQWYLSRSFTLPVVSLLLILPISFAKNIADFKGSSLIGLLTVGYMVFLIIWYYFNPPSNHHIIDISRIDAGYKNWIDVFKVIPVICFSYETHIEAVPLFFNARIPRLATYSLAVLAAILGCATIYTVVGVFGYLTFGNNISSDMLTNYSTSEPLVVVARIMLAIKAIMTYPVILFCARLVVDNLWVTVFTSSHWSEACRRSLQTLILFGVSLIVAMFVPSIGSLISLLGFSGAIFAFICPGVVYTVEYSVWGSRADTARGLLGAVFLIIGALVAGISTTQSVQRILAGEFSHRETTCI